MTKLEIAVQSMKLWSILVGGYAFFACCGFLLTLLPCPLTGYQGAIAEVELAKREMAKIDFGTQYVKK